MYSRYVRRRGKGVHSKYHDLNRKSLGQRKYVRRVFVQGKKREKLNSKLRHGFACIATIPIFEL